MITSPKKDPFLILKLCYSFPFCLLLSLSARPSVMKYISNAFSPFLYMNCSGINTFVLVRLVKKKELGKSMYWSFLINLNISSCSSYTNNGHLIINSLYISKIRSFCRLYERPEKSLIDLNIFVFFQVNS